MAIIDAKFGADRGFDPETEPDGMCPDGALILSDDVVWSDRRRSENIACFAKNIAAVIERHGTNRFRDRNTSLQIYDGQSVAAKGYSKRIEPHWFAAAVEKRALRNDDDTRPGLFKIKPAQRICTASEKSLADRQQTV